MLPLLFILSTLALQDSPRPTTPSATVAVAAARHHDFGNISLMDVLNASRSEPRKTVIRHDFTVRNDTGKPLTLTRFGNSCGCVAATITTGDSRPIPLPTTVAPGSSLAVTVAIDLSQLRPGPLSKSVIVYSRTPGAPENVFTSLSLAGNLLPTATFRDASREPAASPLPGIWNLGRIERSAAARPGAFLLAVTPDPRLLAGQPIPKLVSTYPGLTIEPVASETAGTLRYRLSLSENASIGAMLATLSFAQPAEDKSGMAAAWRNASLIVTAEIAGEIVASPQVVAFGIAARAAAKKPAAVTRSVLLTAENTAVFTGLKIESDNPAVTARLLPADTPDATGRTLVLQLSPQAVAQVVTPGAGATGFFQAHVTLTLTSGERLVLPISAFTVSGGGKP